MKVTYGLAALAIAGCVWAAPAPASAASMSGVLPTVQKSVQADVTEVGRRHWRKHRRWHRRHGWRHRHYYPRYGYYPYYGYRRPYYGYGYGRGYYWGGGPSFSLRIGPRRGYWNRYYW